MNQDQLSKLGKSKLIKMLLSQLQGAENTVKPKTVIPAKFNPKSLTQLAAEKIKQSIRKPAAISEIGAKITT